MDYSAIGGSFQNALGVELPRILGALLILIIGWTLAVVVRGGVRRLLAAARVNRRIAETTEQKVDLESGLSATAFWLIILITLIGVFNTLNLILASGPFEVLVKQVAVYLPRVVAGALLILVAWLAAVAVRAVVNRVLDTSGLDEKLSANAGMEPMSKTVGQRAFLAGDPAVRAERSSARFDLRGLLDPVQGDDGASSSTWCRTSSARAVIGFVGWLRGKGAARARDQFLASGRGRRRDGARQIWASIRRCQASRSLAGTIVFILVFVPTLIAALDALRIEAISRPATEMLDQAARGCAEPGCRGADPRGDLLRRQVRRRSCLGRLLSAAWASTRCRRSSASRASSRAARKPSRLVRGAGPVLRHAVRRRRGGEPARVHPGPRRRDDCSSGSAATVAPRRRRSWSSASGWPIVAHRRHSAAPSVSAFGGPGRGSRALPYWAWSSPWACARWASPTKSWNLAFLLTFGAVAIAVALSFGLGGREAAGKQMEYWLAKFRRSG